MHAWNLRSALGNCRVAARLSLLSPFVLLALAGSGVAAEKADQLTLGGNLNSNRTGGSISYLHAFSGSLRKSGALMRVGASSGETDEDYVTNPAYSGSNYSLEALAGWQSYYKGWRFRALAGALYRGRTGDDRNTDGLGFKVLMQATSPWSAPTYVNATASFDTATDRVVSRLQVGKNFGDKIVGPEGGVAYTSENQRYDFGLFLTGVKLDKFSLSARVGFSHYEGENRKPDSPYLGISATYQF